MKHIERYLFFLLILPIGCNLSPGSYPYAERYEFYSQEQAVINAIETLKTEQPQFKVPEAVGLIDGRDNEQDHWYYIYFYYPEEDQIVFAWIRPKTKDITTLALVSINMGLTIGKWVDINNDLEKSENDHQKMLFENRVIKPIQEILKSEKNLSPIQH